MKLKHHLVRYSLATAAVAAALSAFPAAAATFGGHTVNLVGSATMIGSDLQLNSDYGQAGAAWVAAPLSTAHSFSASFSFSLQSLNVYPMADGITLTLQNQGDNVVGEGGGNVGFNGLNGVGSVVQTWFNNTAGLNIVGDAYLTNAAPADMGAATLVLGTQTVTYNASTSLLSMVGTLNVDGTLYDVSDTIGINLSDRFGSSLPLYIGFTGGTGASLADQRITSFTLSPVPEPEEWAMMLLGFGMVGYQIKRKQKKAAAAVA